MSKLSVNFYKSNLLGSNVRATSIRPFFKIMSLHGFDLDMYKSINNVYNPLNSISEPKIFYVISKTQKYMDEIPLLNNWRCTNNIPVNGKVFNEDVELNIPYCELFNYCQVLFVLSSYFISNDGFLEERYLCAGYLSLFNNHDVFRRGIYELELHPLDQNVYTSLSSIVKNVIHLPEFNGKPTTIPELMRLQKMMRKQLRGQLPSVPMEKITLYKVERRINELKNNSKKVFLSVDFRFSKDISISLPIVLTRPIMPLDNLRKTNRNPVEKKYYSMTRNARAITIDKMRNPNNENLTEIKRILKQPPLDLMTDVESDLIWMYRYYISDKFPTALSKVMRSVKWDYQENSDQVTDILLKWLNSKLHPEHLMELLTSQFLNPIVRKFAVKKLDKASDDDLFLYLFQLIQALRYEIFEEILTVEPGFEKQLEDSVSDNILPSLYPSFIDMSMYSLIPQKILMTSISSNKVTLQLNEDLSSFLIRRCKGSRKLSSYFFWFLKLESENKQSGSSDAKTMFQHVLKRFSVAMDQGDLDSRNNSVSINCQVLFVEDLTRLVKDIVQSPLRISQKTEMLKNELRSNKYPNITNIQAHFSSPLNPDCLIAEIDVEASSVLKSSQSPVKLVLISSNHDKIQVIFKDGDDLRQDQVVLQMINFMDQILRRENFDLKLTPYKVLATTSQSGFIEFVNSRSISDIQGEYQTILNYLRCVAPSSSDHNQVESSVMDTYIRSLAGYCVITYLLGIGDRHLDNIMLTENGHFFHIDFGFVLGNDPKPLPPEVRLTKDMIDAMGGANDPLFNRFCDHAFNTFNYLRRHANQCLSLLSLITDAGIKDFSMEQVRAVDFVRERFLLDCTEEQAIHTFADRLTASVKAIFPEIMEKLHRFAMRFK